jgi:hypothetical protein
LIDEKNSSRTLFTIQIGDLEIEDIELIILLTSLSFKYLKISFVVVGPNADKRIAAFSCPLRSAYCTSGSNDLLSSATLNSC